MHAKLLSGQKPSKDEKIIKSNQFKFSKFPLKASRLKSSALTRILFLRFPPNPLILKGLLAILFRPNKV